MDEFEPTTGYLNTMIETVNDLKAMLIEQQSLVDRFESETEELQEKADLVQDLEFQIQDKRRKIKSRIWDLSALSVMWKGV